MKMHSAAPFLKPWRDDMRKKRKKKIQRVEFQRDTALDFIKSEKGRPVFTWIFQIAVTLALAAVVAIFFFQSIAMEESSMEPTLLTGERFFINKLIYKFASPDRGDIIAFTKDGSDDATIHIKRIIGLPGETIEIRDGIIYIDGQVYQEDEKLPQITNPGLAEDGVSLANDEYFVLGDNRNNSEDSRFAEVQNINEKYIKGKVWFCIYPVDQIGFIKN